MPRQNLKTLRGLYERWAAGDWSEVPPYDSHVVYASQATELEPGPHYGREAFDDYFRRFISTWNDFRIEGTEFREHGDSVVVRVRRTATGKESGIPIDDEASHVWTFRGDKVIRLEVFEQEAEALEAVGLSPESPDSNLEVVRRIYDAVARGDSAAVFALYDPEVELDATQLSDEAIAATEVLHGHEGLRRFFREWDEAWEESDFELDELMEAGDQVVACVTRRGRGRASGVEVEMPGAAVWTIRNGRVIRAVFFSTPAEALEAAGVPN